MISNKLTIALICRMDEDQSARRVAQKYLKVVDSDYYEFETHIFFDDAFEVSDVCDDWMQVRLWKCTHTNLVLCQCVRI